MSVPQDVLIQQLAGALSGLAVGSDANREQFRQRFEKNALILLGGLTGGPQNTALASLYAGGLDLTFMPLKGGTLVENQVGMYPFANQSVAANAIITQPLRISLLMIAPAGSVGNATNGFGISGPGGSSVGYLSKAKAMTALAQAFQQHNNLGGLYGIYTPAYAYANCIMTGMFDISDGRSQQVQYQWRLDFVQPLITQQQAQQAMSSLMQKLSDQSPQIGQPAWSGPSNGNPAQLPVTANSGLIAPSAVQ